MANLIDHLNWRHAVKAYIPNKKVAQADVDKIVEAARLAPTSSGLQPFKVIVLENQDIKGKLSNVALNPECMRDCSHVLVFAAWDNYTEERIDAMFDYTTDERDLPRGRFSSYTDMIKGIYLNRPAEENFAHTARQTYIALGLALAQAAELKVDTTPAEGFDSEKLDDILKLGEHGLKSVSLLYVGYADEENDWMKPMKKVRRPTDDFVINIK